MRIALALALIGAAACGGGDDRLGECPGERPAIADCYVGEFFADCGGTGEAPVLGCNEQGSCLWFTGGCAPEGYVGSSCGSDNVCCHDMWPFDGERESGLGFQLIRFGTSGWDRTTAATIGLTVEPALTGTTTTVTCSGTDPNPAGFTACDTAINSVRVLQRGATTIEAILVDPGVAGWSLWTEIVDDGTGTTRARVCEAEYSDQPDLCFPHDAICATTGTVTINQLPVVDNRQLVVDVDVTFANGFSVVATLVPTL